MQEFIILISLLCAFEWFYHTFYELYYTLKLPIADRNIYISSDIISTDMQTIQLVERKYSEQRAPTLNTVLMVEETLMNAEGVLTVAELKRLLPKQVMHQTLMKILDYLEWSGKIVFRGEKVLWTYNPDSRLKNMKGQRVR